MRTCTCRHTELELEPSWALSDRRGAETKDQEPERPAVKYHSNTDLALQNWRHVHTVEISLPFVCVHNAECGSVHVQTHRAWTLSDRRGAETEDQEPGRPAA